MKCRKTLLAVSTAAAVLQPASIFAAEPPVSIQGTESTSIVPHNIETWAGYGSFGFNMYNGVQVYAVMTYANGNWGTRAQIVSAQGACSDAVVSQTARQGDGVVAVWVYCASISRTYKILVNVYPV